MKTIFEYRYVCCGYGLDSLPEESR